MKITPRPYQRHAVNSVFNYFRTEDGNPIIALPTGTGKSIVIADFIYETLKAWPSTRVLMLTHVKELIAQNADKLCRMWPGAPVGIYSAGLKQKRAGMPITFAGIQSAVNKPKLFGHVDIVFIDECHLISPNQDTSYRKFLAALREVNPKLKVVGLTATPYRLGLGLLTESPTFDAICYNLTQLEEFNKLMDDGYLCPLIPKSTLVELDVKGVGKRGGEFIEKQLQEAVDVETITREAIHETREVANDREHVLVFATGVNHAENIVDELHAVGETATCVHSKIKSKERDQRLADFKSGKYRFMVNNNILTTGFDFPEMDCIVMLRPTSSPGLWVQMLGRGTRPAPGKENCLVLDFAGNTMRLGPINDVRIPKQKGKGSGEIPVKLCRYDNTVSQQGCGAYNHISARFCCDCKEEFTFEVKIAAKAATKQLVVRSEPVITPFTVDRVVYGVHKKMGKPDSIKVTYHCGIRAFSEYITAWHSSNIKHKARSWWNTRTDVPLPVSAVEAVQHFDTLSTPTTIKVWVNQKHPRILSYEF